MANEPLAIKYYFSKPDNYNDVIIYNGEKMNTTYHRVEDGTIRELSHRVNGTTQDMFQELVNEEAFKNVVIVLTGKTFAASVSFRRPITYDTSFEHSLFSKSIIPLTPPQKSFF